MIIDKVKNMERYIPEKYREKIIQYMKSVTPEIEEGRYEIEGEEVFARVMSYETKPRAKCRIEAHNQHIDIQITLSGAESIDIFERTGLEIEETRTEEDIVFFLENNRCRYAANNNIPDYFTMIFPEEAHRPKEQVLGFDAYVKKIVIKIKV